MMLKLDDIVENCMEGGDVCVVGGRIHLLRVGQEFWIVFYPIFLEGIYVNCLFDLVG